MAFSVKQPAETPLFRVSMRSASEFDVSAVCALFGGGGHKNAAGARYKGKLSEAVEMIKQAIPKFVESL